jgi:hypothetical protein
MDFISIPKDKYRYDNIFIVVDCHGGLAGKLEISRNNLNSIDLCEVAKVRN